MKYLTGLVLSILLAGCKRDSSRWQVLDFGSFTLKTPPGWEKIEREGIDSYVGGLTNHKDTLWFDYGWYSPQVGDENPESHMYARDTVNGLVADIVIPVSSGTGYIGMYIPVDGNDKFSMIGYRISSVDTILRIFKSVVFEVSDTSMNSKLSLSKFVSSPYGNGKSLYVQKCASCHSINKNLTGPALVGAMESRSANWLFHFFTDRGSIEQDSGRLRLKALYGEIECARFPELTLGDVEAIKEFVSSH